MLSLLMLFGGSGKAQRETAYAPPTEAEVTRALKDALSTGIARSTRLMKRVLGRLS
jgi:hypothetical protein